MISSVLQEALVRTADNTTSAPKLDITISTQLQTVLRGFAIVLVAALLIMLLVKNINFGRSGGMGGRGKMEGKTVIVTLLAAAMLMDVDLFVTILNWSIEFLYEIGGLVKGWFKSADGGSGLGTGGGVAVQ